MDDRGIDAVINKMMNSLVINKLVTETANNLAKGLAKRLLPALVCCLISVPGFAQPADQPSAAAMAGDMLVARPVGFVMTIAGSAVFVVSLPFSALGGNVKQAAKTLVVGPAAETFVRCLGCTSSRVRVNNE